MKLLYTDPQPAQDDGDFDPVTVIADALRSKFGDDALRVARLQHDHAIPESATQWSEVVTRLSA